jgi:hypothetical protein
MNELNNSIRTFIIVFAFSFINMSDIKSHTIYNHLNQNSYQPGPKKKPSTNTSQPSTQSITRKSPSTNSSQTSSRKTPTNAPVNSAPSSRKKRDN